MTTDLKVGGKVLLPEYGEPYDNPKAVREFEIISISTIGTTEVFEVEGMDVYFGLETFTKFQETYKKIQRIVSIWE
jgi:hypothetical protein